MNNSRSFIEATLVLCAVLAILCISAGVVALMAHNWDDFPKALRLVLAFVPIGMGIAVFYRAFFHHPGSKVWMESSATFLVLMTGSSIALVTQIYQINHFNQTLLLWMILSLPVLYLANSSAVTIVYLAGITWWLVLQNMDSFDLFSARFHHKPLEVLGYWLLVPAVIPHFMRYFKNGQQTLRTQILGWFSVVIVLYGANLGFTMHHTVGYSLAIAAAYVLGKMLFPHGLYFWNRPLQTVALILSSVLVFFLTFDFFLYYSMTANHYIKYDRTPAGGDGLVTAFNYILLLLFAAFIVVFYIKDLNGPKRMNPFLVFLPFVVMVGLLLAANTKQDDDNMYFSWWHSHFTLAKWWFNVYIVGFIAYYLYKGVTMRINGIVTYAVFMLSFWLLIRYFDIDISFYLKGLMYVGIGVALLLFNQLYTRKALEPAEDNKKQDPNAPLDLYE